MKFKTIKITPRGKEYDTSWDVEYNNLPDECLKVLMKPNALGYYHYPENVTDEQAFNQLKHAIIFAYERHIKGLQKSLDNLKSIVYNQIKIE